MNMTGMNLWFISNANDWAYKLIKKKIDKLHSDNFLNPLFIISGLVLAQAYLTYINGIG